MTEVTALRTTIFKFFKKDNKKSNDESLAGTDGHSSSSESSVVDYLTKFRPYDFEPLASSTSEGESEHNSDGEIENYACCGNKELCQCDKCICMESELENICCVESKEIQDSFFEGITAPSQKTLFNSEHGFLIWKCI